MSDPTKLLAPVWTHMTQVQPVRGEGIYLYDADGRRYTGNQHNRVKALVLDGSNNVEVVHIGKAKAGTWTIDVVASNVTQGPQDHALVAVQV